MTPERMAELRRWADRAASEMSPYVHEALDEIERLEQALRDAREHLSRMYGIASGNMRAFPNNWTLQAMECLVRIDTALGKDGDQ